MGNSAEYQFALLIVIHVHMYEHAPLPLRVAVCEMTSQCFHCGWRTALLLLSLLLSHPQAE